MVKEVADIDSMQDAKLEVVLEWRRVKSLIDEKVEDLVSGMGDEALPEIVKYITEGGKRFRGFLTVITAEALGGSAEEALDAALAVELVHAASLAIDDIIDIDMYRRGRPAAWFLHGVSKTVLSSLLMVPVAQRAIERYGFKAIYYVIRAWESTVRGEIMDAFLSGVMPGEKYIEMIELKTGSLFKLSTVLGVLAARRMDYLKPMEEYGRLIGLIYQIADDIADYQKHLTGGKKLDPGEKLFEKWITSTTGIKERELIPQTAIKELIKLITKAKTHIEALPDSKQKRILKTLPEFMANKMLQESQLTLKT